jgi:hypothetical protein
MRLLTLALVLTASICSAQPSTLPLIQSGHVAYLGSFTFPTSDGAGGAMDYGGYGLGIGANGSLYVGCSKANGYRQARISIPAIGGVASVLQPCRAVTNAIGVDPGTPNGVKVGGSILWNGRLIVSAFSFYDAEGNAVASHFWANPDMTGVQGPVALTTVNGFGPGLVGGYMGVVPEAWRTLLGGPALTGACCLSVISRSSAGPAVSVFNPDHVGAQSPVPQTPLVGYPTGHPLAPWDVANPLFTGVTRMAGVALPEGTRSVLFIGRHGDSYCYGGASCNDPTDTSQGVHGYPYHYRMWAYDANDLAAVKAGTKQPWEPQPYAVWTLPAASITTNIAPTETAVYDPATRRIYLAAGGSGVRVHVWEVAAPVADAPCQGSWSEYGRVAPPVGEPLQCVSTPEGWRESWTEERAFTMSAPPQGNGAACPASPESRPMSQSCTPPPVNYTCTVQATALVAGTQVLLSTCGPVIDNAAVPVGAVLPVSVPRP